MEVSRKFAATRPHVELVELQSNHELTDVLDPIWDLIWLRLGQEEDQQGGGEVGGG